MNPLVFMDAGDARYLVGIDLGTTHTVVAYADLSEGRDPSIQAFAIEQLVGAGQVAARESLPSVRYHPGVGELDPRDWSLPWSSPSVTEGSASVLGEWAQVLGSKSHGRLVTSAKSWLSHRAVDRLAAILPWGAAEGVLKISPVEASASYLAHVRHAWNQRFSDQPLERQRLVLTVPASFDDGARALTLQAAGRAGLPSLRLLEEPQAACYDWLWQHRGGLNEALSDVRLILVCDVGGGTTDFTLIRVDRRSGSEKLTRIGVGDHLMLGGDNMDLAVARWIEEKLLPEARLTAAEWSQLVAQCRRAKEDLLAPEAPDSTTVTLLGTGARLVGGARSVTIDRGKLVSLVLDGFLPLVEASEVPERKRSGVVEFGLPYASDAAISRHLAAFLGQHQLVMRQAVEGDEVALPDAVLLNGGVFRSELFAERLMELVDSWGSVRPKRLANLRPEQAVAFGAVAYGLARLGRAVEKIGGGSARSYFLLLDGGHEGDAQTVCVLPRGAEEGVEIALPERRFALKMGQPVRFHLYCSTADIPYRAGELVALNSVELIELPPLAAVFDAAFGEPIVRLTAEMSEVGTLALQCVSELDDRQRWKLEFDLRTGGVSAGSSGEAHPRLQQAAELIRLVFGRKVKNLDPKAVKGLRSELERTLGPRESWDTALCRCLFGALLEGLAHRRRSSDHERLWLNLTGFCLRPGFGDPVDDWRVRQIWAIYPLGPQFVTEAQNWAEWWTLWRRVAGGLGPEAQERIFADVAEFIDPDASRRNKNAALAKKRGYEDMVRLAASLERLSCPRKVDLGAWLLARLKKPGEAPESWWALGRIGSRVLFHGSAHEVVPRETAEEWLAELLSFDWRKNAAIGFTAALIARKSGDRERDISREVEDQVLGRLRAAKLPESWASLVSQVQALNASEERRVFGEGLPAGLTLVR